MIVESETSREAVVLQGTKRPRVLLLDDEAGFRLATVELLSRHGFDCESGGDADEARSQLQGGDFDLIVADINMPGNQDLGFLRYCKEHHPDLPIVLITAYPSVPTAVDALRLEVLDYVVKPASFEELRDRIEAAIEKGRLKKRASRIDQDLSSVVGAYAEVRSAVAKLGLSVQQTAGATAGADGSAADALGGAGDLSIMPNAELERCLGLISTREREVLLLLIHGERVPSIAKRLFISPTTVRNHIKSIFRKTGVHSQLELVVKLRGRPS
jgi:DNA-binding NarL/FixJ family response regulator